MPISSGVWRDHPGTELITPKRFTAEGVVTKNLSAFIDHPLDIVVNFAIEALRRKSLDAYGSIRFGLFRKLSAGKRHCNPEQQAYRNEASHGGLPAEFLTLL